MFCFIKGIFSSFSNFQPSYTEATSVQYLAIFIGAYNGNCSDRALFVLDVQTSQASISSCACSNPSKLLLCDLFFWMVQPCLRQRGEKAACICRVAEVFCYLPALKVRMLAISKSRKQSFYFNSLTSLINWPLLNMWGATKYLYTSVDFLGGGRGTPKPANIRWQKRPAPWARGVYSCSHVQSLSFAWCLA